MEKIIIGCHVSFNKDRQLFGSVSEALQYGANTFMFYTGAPQNTTRLPLNSQLTQQGQQLMKENGIDINNVIIHAPYIINLANAANQEFGVRFLKEEIHRAEQLGISKIVLHPGSHVGIGVEQGLQNIIDALNLVLDDNQKVVICLETMAGKGTELGTSFEQIQTIIKGVSKKDKVMVCLDTCHIHDAGYDVSQIDDLLEQFDTIIGLEKLACIHINDSKNMQNSHKDRHENFGLGNIGFDNLLHVIYHDKLKDVPKILETPYVSMDDSSKERMYPPYKFEIQEILQKQQIPNLLEEIRTYYK